MFPRKRKRDNLMFSFDINKYCHQFVSFPTNKFNYFVSMETKYFLKNKKKFNFQTVVTTSVCAYIVTVMFSVFKTK